MSQRVTLIKSAFTLDFKAILGTAYIICCAATKLVASEKRVILENDMNCIQFNDELQSSRIQRIYESLYSSTSVIVHLVLHHEHSAH
jgi:hypothetical protein